MKSLIAILSLSIVLLCWGVDLSAQDKKDDKRLEITGYFGAGGNGRDAELRPFYFDVSSYGFGLEYYLTPRISVEGEINYLPNTAFANPPTENLPWWYYSDKTLIGSEQKYRLLWDINLLLYFELTKVIKRPAVRLFLTVGTGYQYDSVEETYVSLTMMEQYKYGYGSFWFQWISFGAGLKVNIKDDWALRLIYKIHYFAGDEVQTNRLALGLSYRF